MGGLDRADSNGGNDGSGEISGDAAAPITPVVAAQSCSAAAVQAALTSAPDGVVVAIPAGDCDWGTTSVSRKAGIWLKGAGKNLTTLRRTGPMTIGGNFLIDFDCSNGKRVEVSDLKLLGNDDLQSDAARLADQDNGLRLANGCLDFKIHDAEFSKFSDAGLTIRGRDSRGVVYQSEFISNFKCQPTPVSCLGYGVVVYGDSTVPWSVLSLGTRDAVFIEDNYFYDNRHGVASNLGSRYVFRNNRVVTTQRTRNFGMIDAHGRGSYPPGSRSWEIYNNTLETYQPTITADGISIRGGDGVIFGNTISSRIPYVVSFREESDCAGTYPVMDQTRDAYIWNNTWDGPVRVSAGCASFILQDRDYFLKPRPGYGPYAYPHPLR